jgi:pseudaminic acid cytidylyltransferase
VTSFPSAPQRALRQLPDGRIKPLFNQFISTRSQDLEPTFYDAGQFYWGSSRSWLQEISIHDNAAGLVIPSWRVVDIDTEEDWRRAEVIFSALASELRAG